MYTLLVLKCTYTLYMYVLSIHVHVCIHFILIHLSCVIFVHIYMIMYVQVCVLLYPMAVELGKDACDPCNGCKCPPSTIKASNSTCETVSFLVRKMML